MLAVSLQGVVRAGPIRTAYFLLLLSLLLLHHCDSLSICKYLTTTEIITTNTTDCTIVETAGGGSAVIRKCDIPSTCNDSSCYAFPCFNCNMTCSCKDGRAICLRSCGPRQDPRSFRCLQCSEQSYAVFSSDALSFICQDCTFLSWQWIFLPLGLVIIQLLLYYLLPNHKSSVCLFLISVLLYGVHIIYWSNFNNSFWWLVLSIYLNFGILSIFPLRHSTYLQVFLYFVQICTVVELFYHRKRFSSYPKDSLTSPFLLKSSSFSCILPDPLNHLNAFLYLHGLIFLIYSTVLSIGSFLSYRQHTLDKWLNTSIPVGINLLRYTWFPVFLSSTALFLCRTPYDHKKLPFTFPQYLAEYPWVLCPPTTFSTLLGLLFSIIPIAIGIALCLSRNNRAESKFNYIFQIYEYDYWWFDIVFELRKVFLSISIIFINFTVYWMCLITFSLLVNFMKPYSRSVVDFTLFKKKFGPFVIGGGNLMDSATTTGLMVGIVPFGEGQNDYWGREEDLHLIWQVVAWFCYLLALVLMLAFFLEIKWKRDAEELADVDQFIPQSD